MSFFCCTCSRRLLARSVSAALSRLRLLPEVKRPALLRCGNGMTRSGHRGVKLAVLHNQLVQRCGKEGSAPKTPMKRREALPLLDLGRCVAARGVRAKSDETCFGFLGLNDALAQSQISHCTNSMPFKAALLRSNIRAQTLGRLRLFPELG